MNALEFEQKMTLVVKNERKSTLEVLEMINLTFDRKHHLELGYSSLFDYLVKAHGYSEGAAQRRIQAAKLLRAVPDISPKIEAGSLNLTTLSKTQSLLQAQEKVLGEKLETSKKEEILELIENKSTDQVEKELLQIFPDLSKEDRSEKLVRVGVDTSRLTTHLDEETLADLERAKELLSHVLPQGNFTDVMKYVLKDFLKRKDPLRKIQKRAKVKRTAVDIDESSPQIDRIIESSSVPAVQASTSQLSALADPAPISSTAKKSTATAPKPCVKAKVKRLVFQKSQGCCQYRNPTTGKVCGTRFQPQVDHIKPKAFGGSDEPENLRQLCRAHNLLMAERNLGVKRMQHYFP